MAFIEPMHRNKPNITYLFTSVAIFGMNSACEALFMQFDPLRPEQNGHHENL